MKILYIESGTSGGGSFQSLYQHLRVINRKCFHPVVVYLNNNRYIEPVKSLGIPVYILTDLLYSNHVSSYLQRVLHKMAWIIESRMPIFYIIFLRLAHMPLLRSLDRIIYDEKINVIHLNVQISRDIFGLFVAEKTKVPCISHLRSMQSGGFDRYRANYANRIVSIFIANSSSTKQYWEKHRIDSEKIKVVYNAIIKERIIPKDIRRTWKIEKSVSFVIGCVGRFAHWKGHGFLLQSFKGFLELRPDAILLLVGDGTYREEVVQQAIKLCLRNHVIFTGYVAQAQEIIASLDLLVLPSQNEPFGRVLLEAMVVGTPVVATDGGGIPEVVKHEYNGILVSYGDVKGMQKAMEKVLTDKDIRSRLVENGYQTVNQFSMENYEADLEKIYRSVVKG